MPVRPWQSPLSDSTAGSGPYQGRALRREWCQDGLPLLKSPIKVRWVTDGSQMGHRWVTDGSQMGHRSPKQPVVNEGRAYIRGEAVFKNLWWGWGWWLWWWLWWWWGPVQWCACGTSMPFLKAFWRSPLLYQPSAWRQCSGSRWWLRHQIWQTFMCTKLCASAFWSADISRQARAFLFQCHKPPVCGCVAILLDFPDVESPNLSTGGSVVAHETRKESLNQQDSIAFVSFVLI